MQSLRLSQERGVWVDVFIPLGNGGMSSEATIVCSYCEEEGETLGRTSNPHVKRGTEIHGAVEASVSRVLWNQE